MTNYQKFPIWRKYGIVIKFNDGKFSWCENTPANRKYLKTSDYCSKAIEFYVWEIDKTYQSKKELDEYIDQREKTQKALMICAQCGNQLVVRKNRQNGELFLGCSKYPVCKFTKKT
jgi:ssDNA-binding Zn-finger/Zn-ribbon topoisomerase 1